MQPIIPSYSYNEQTTLASCLQEFFRANPKLDPEQLFKSIGVVDPLVWKRWMSGQWNQSLLSVYKQSIENVMGIDLDRLVIIHLKHEILDDLDHLHTIEKKDPRLAHLLQRNPQLKERISFSVFLTRLEIVQKILECRSQIGGGLLARQLGIPSRTSLVVSWDLQEKLPGWVPGETGHLRDLLKRCLIVLFAGIRSGKREDVRVALIAEELLGCSPDQTGFINFENVLHALKNLDPNRSVSNISAQTDLPRTTTKRLVFGKIKNPGKIPEETILALVKALLKIRFPALCEAIDKAAREYPTDHGVIHPVFRSEKELSQALFPQTQDQKKDCSVQKTIPLVTPVVSSPNHEHNRTTILLHYLLEQMKLLLETIPKKEESSEYAEMMGTIGLTKAFLETRNVRKTKLQKLTEDQKSALLHGFGLMLKLGKFLVKLCPEDREELVPSVDKLLLSLAQQLTAASLENPLEFLEQMNFETATKHSSGRKPS